MRVLTDLKKPHILLLWLALLTPSFPSTLATELHVNILAAAFSICYIISTKSFSLKNNIFVLYAYFLVLQAFIFTSWGADIHSGVASLFDIASVLRPLYLLLIATFFYLAIRSNKTTIFDDLRIMFAFQVSLAIGVWALTMLSTLFQDLWFFLYLREDKPKIHDSATTFFYTTYYAAYYYLIPFIFFLSSFTEKNKLSDLLFFLISFLLLILAHSKTFYPVALASILMSIWITYRNLTVRLGLISSTAVGLSLSIFFVSELTLILGEIAPALEKLIHIIKDPEKFGSVTVRLEQTAYALNSSLENYGFGAGLGRGSDMRLESYLSQFPYRYGIFGFFVYCAFFIYISFKALKIYFASTDQTSRILSKFIFIWAALLPVTLFSSPMIEIAKLSIFSFMVIALLFVLDGDTRTKPILLRANYFDFSK